MTAPDPTILAAAIKCAEEDLHLHRDIDDPEVNKVRALVAAAKAYQVVRAALEKAACDFADIQFSAPPVFADMALAAERRIHAAIEKATKP